VKACITSAPARRNSRCCWRTASGSSTAALGGPGAGLGEGEGGRGEGQHLYVAPLLQGEHEAAISDDGAVGEPPGTEGQGRDGMLLNLSVS
jgi:hypothetical protein